jgi:hypothetical protein
LNCHEGPRGTRKKRKNEEKPELPVKTTGSEMRRHRISFWRVDIEEKEMLKSSLLFDKEEDGSIMTK